MAPHPPNKQSNAAAQQLNSLNLDNNNEAKLGKASYKKFSTSSQFGHVLSDASSGSASTRQPTPGISKSMALLNPSSDNFKSNATTNLGSKSDLQKSAASSEKENSIIGSHVDSKPAKEGNSTESNRDRHHLPNISSKFPPPSQQPLWQAVNKPLLENKRTSYNQVVLGGARHPEGNLKQQQVWGRMRRNTVTDIEGIPGDIGSNKFVGSNARGPQNGYV